MISKKDVLRGIKTRQMNELCTNIEFIIYTKRKYQTNKSNANDAAKVESWCEGKQADSKSWKEARVR